MALTGIQEYIAQDANNIARVEDDVSEHAQIYVDNIIAFLVTKRVEHTILIWPLKSLYK